MPSVPNIPQTILPFQPEREDRPPSTGQAAYLIAWDIYEGHQLHQASLYAQGRTAGPAVVNAHKAWRSGLGGNGWKGIFKL